MEKKLWIFNALAASQAVIHSIDYLMLRLLAFLSENVVQFFRHSLNMPNIVTWIHFIPYILYRLFQVLNFGRK